MDEEETLSQRDWSGRDIGTVYIVLVLSVHLFDIVTFLFFVVIFYVRCCVGGTTYLNIVDPVMQSAVYCFISDRMVFRIDVDAGIDPSFPSDKGSTICTNSPSIPVVCTTFAGIITFTALTFTKSAGVIGLTEIANHVFPVFICCSLTLYASDYGVKTVYQKKYHGADLKGGKPS